MNVTKHQERELMYNNSDLNKDDRLKSRSSTGTEECDDTKGVIEDGQLKRPRNRRWTVKKTQKSKMDS